MQIVGAGRGVLLMGGLGGMTSSTATTLTFARLARLDTAQLGGRQALILVANLAELLRLAALAAAVSPGALPALLPMPAGGFVAGAAAAARTLR